MRLIKQLTYFRSVEIPIFGQDFQVSCDESFQPFTECTGNFLGQRITYTFFL